MFKICTMQSPLCNDWDLYNKGKEIFESKGFSWYIALGIMNAESTIGKNYAGTCNSSWNNWGGIKWRKLDDGTAVKDQPIPNNGCWLYKFDSLEDYFNSKANTLAIGYKGCLNQSDIVRCISYAYVGNPNVAEQSWINNVKSIGNL